MWTLTISLFAIILIAWLLGYVLFVKKLNRLLEAACQLGQGDLSVRTGIAHRRGKLGRLARSFDEMAEALEKKEQERKQAEETIKENETLLRRLIETLPVGLIMIDPVTRNIEKVNQTAAMMFGAPSDQIIGHRCHAFLCPADEGKCPVCDLGKDVDASERIMLRADGSRRAVLKTVKRIKIRGEEKLLECFVDISERKAMEEELRKSQERFKQLAEAFPETIFEAGTEGEVTYLNKHGFEQFGYTPEDLAKGVNIIDCIAPADRDKVLRRLKEKSQEGIAGGYLEYQAQRKDGATFKAMSLAERIMVNGMAAGFRGFILDITARKQAEERIKYLATHDALTDLPTLRLARDRLGVAISQSRRNKTAVAVMFIDLDGFKCVNDNLGHDAGDYVLKEVAKRLRSCVREGDTVARVGGDEFLAILSGINARKNAAQIAEKIIHVVSKPIIYNEEQATVGASVGISLYPDHGEDLERLIREADDAMYRIKKAGKNGFCFAQDQKLAG